MLSYKVWFVLFSSSSSSLISIDFPLESACFGSSKTNVLQMLFGTIGVESTNNCNSDSLLLPKERLTHLFLCGHLGLVRVGNIFGHL